MSRLNDALAFEHEGRYREGAPQVVEILPPHESRNVDVEEIVGVRFSKRMDPATLNSETVTLFGPGGVSPALITPVEGMLAFVKPKAQMQPGARYSMFIDGAHADDGSAMPFFASSFQTAPLVHPTPPRAGSIVTSLTVVDPSRVHPLAHVTWRAADGSGADSWTPDQQNIESARWTDGRALRERKLSPLAKAPAGITAVAGRVLRINGEPLAGVTLKIGGISSTSDSEGAFLLSDVSVGYGVLEIDGGTVTDSASRDQYGRYFARVKTETGKTLELGYSIWMQKLDPRGTFKISSPTTQETILSTPSIPGLELRIPAGTVIWDKDGKIVTEVNITAIPVNKPPFPIPQIDVPVYFTVQPGGAWLQSVNGGALQGAQLYYPNYKKSLPGTRSEFFNYDPYEREWYVYGEGQVSPDGAQIVPDAKTRIYEFTGAMVNGSSPAPPEGPKPCDSGCCAPANAPPGGGAGSGEGAGGWGKEVDSGGAGCDGTGDPVSASTGYFFHTERDLYLSDVMPLSLTRTYRSQDNSQRTFGIGWISLYDTMLYSQQQFQEVDLILADGGRAHFVRVTPGTAFSDALFECTTPGPYYKLQIQRNNPREGWELVFRDGSKWFFPQMNPIKEITDANGNTITIIRRDSGGISGPITRVESPNGRYIDFTLDTAGRVTAAKDNLGRTFTYAYDATGRLTKVTDPLNGERNYTYDSNHRLLTAKDPRNTTAVTNEYDTNGRVSKQTLADGNYFTYAYTLTSGKVTRTEITDQRGKVRRVDFDADGRISSSVAAYGTADAQTTTFGRNGSAQLTSITDPLGRVTSLSYDSWGNRTGVTKLYGTANAVTTTRTFTADGARVASVTDALNKTSSFTYDSRANLLTATDPLNHTVTYTRDAQGRALTRSDALSHTWTYTYNGADLATVTDPLSRVTQIFTDGAGRTVAMRDPLGNVVRGEYDLLNRFTKLTDALTGTVQFGYDANGNLTSHTDQNNNTTSYSYNNLSLRSARTDSLTNAESFAYGANGKISRVTDRKSQVTGITYDNLNRVSQVGFGATVSNPTTYTATVDYTYDAGNRATQIADSANGTITRTYDGLDRLTQEQTPQGTVSYTYDAAGRRATMTVAGQSAVTYTWDDAGRLTQMAQGSDSITFTYDNANRRTKTTLANGVEIAYGYDNASQLTSITYSKGGTTIGDLAYTYDAGGRRTKVSGSLAKVDLPAAVTSGVYNAANQLTSWAGSTFSYDLNGNLTGDGTNTYSWDARNQLSGMSGGVSASFGYDAFGRRRTKTVGSAQTGFLYDGVNFVQELNGSTVTANLLTGGVDEVFQRTEGSTKRHPVTDALGSVIGLTDGTGALATEYSFEPYGKASSTGSADTNGQKYTGREDDGTGLFYYRARYYMPGCGRFVSEDPLGINAGANPYQYVSGNPITSTDPLGLTECDIGVAFDTAWDFFKDSQPPIYGWDANLPRDSKYSGRNWAGYYIQLDEGYKDDLSDIGATAMYHTVLHELYHRPISGGLGWRFHFGDDTAFDNEIDRRLGVSLDEFKKRRTAICGK